MKNKILEMKNFAVTWQQLVKVIDGKFKKSLMW